MQGYCYLPFHRSFLTALIFILLTCCSKPTLTPVNIPSPYPLQDLETDQSMQKTLSVNELVSRMTIEEKVGQIMIIGFDGADLDAGLNKMITDFHVGGVILFARNVESPGQVARLNSKLQQAAIQSGHPGLFIAIDQEGGRVTRLTADKGFTEFPSAMALAASTNPENAKAIAQAIAIEMRTVGLNIDFAPVLDVNNNPANPVIGLRSFSSDPAIVAEFGIAYMKGLQESGVLAFGKHFPGHGDTAVDSHINLPVVPHDMQRLQMVELLPFQAAIDAGVAGIMSAHVTFPAIDSTPRLAASLSTPVLTGLLRQQMGFQGLLVTDSLEMGALAQSGYPAPKAAALALQAGADLLLFNRDHKMHQEAHALVVEWVKSGKIPLARLDKALRRVLQAKAAYSLLSPSLPEAGSAAQTCGAPEHKALVRRVAGEAITLLHDQAGLLPLTPGEKLLVVEPAILRGVGSQLGGTIFKMSENPSASEIANIMHISQDGRKVMVSIYNTGNNPGQVRLVQALLQAGRPLILLARSPYDLLQLSQVGGTVLISYDFNQTVREALAAILSGSQSPGGCLPVELPNLYPIGSGLQGFKP